MRRAILTATIILLVASTASAAPSCRDGKGLFTPCIGERAPPAEHHRPDSQRAGPTGAPRADRSARAPEEKPPLVGRTTLCRDSKGLFTPCVR